MDVYVIIVTALVGALIVVVVVGVAMLRLLRQQGADRRRVDDEGRHVASSALAAAREAAAQVKAEAETHKQRALAEADDALQQAQDVRRDGETALRMQRDELRQRDAALERREARQAEREDSLDAQLKVMATRQSVADEIADDLRFRAKELARAEEHQRSELERIATMTAQEAKAQLLADVAHEAKLQAAVIAREIEAEAQRAGEDKAKSIVVTAMQRMAAPATSESVVTTVSLPSDDMKGRIIGREGRNIRSFEQVTGVNLLIDDTPESVLLSSFDPVRREIARLTLTELIADGRIHPARIEEVHAHSAELIASESLREAEAVLTEMRITDLHPDLVSTLGSLRFRTSYGQNVLSHLVECGHLAGMMAAELGVDAAVCRRAALLHDIGKALTHEAEGSHALVGADLARRSGEDPDIVHAIEAHHNEVEPRTVEAVLVQVADAISGSRPGARRESLEAYVNRMGQLESIAQSMSGVERVFAMHAGREVRVMVSPAEVDDEHAAAIARDIARRVSEELTYPGQVKITVVRESRATSIAH